jgi:2-succinyl-5-enolpyruvyl-6-hydroxy-3-cyclohexene-1-carboxylate synthase
VTPENDAPRNASAALSTTVLDELVRRGLRHVVLAPGSRSAPLAFAAHRAAVEGRLTLHTRIDERSAGFLALGLAVTSRSPVAIVTTSGTAVANLHPAVLEASHKGVPLVVLTADRPARLRGTQANQTTDQVRIFGTAPRFDADVPPGDPAADRDAQAAQVETWRALVGDAVAAAKGAAADAADAGADAGPGPVHLNLQLAEPLVPGDPDGWSAPVSRSGVEGDSGAAHDARAEPDARTGRGFVATAPATAAEAVDEHLLEPGPRTVVIAGDDAGPPARVLAEENGWPLLAEPTSGSRTGANAIRTYRLLLGEEDLVRRIERVVVCGHPTLSRPVARLMSSPDVEVVAVRNATGYTDPGHRVSRVLRWPVSTGSTTRDGSTTADPAWLDEWRERDAARGAALDALLTEQGRLTPHQVAGAVAAALPAGGLLLVGASNPVRDLDLMVPRYRVGDRRMVIGNRGLAGIDGSVSSAIGAALGRPHSTRAFALLGDVTFLHDANGLVLGPDEPRPDLTVVVVNDDGGSIFSSLEQGGSTYSASFERLFGTPHHVDLAALCAATRTPHWRVESLEELRHALASPAGGIEVVEAVVTRHDRRALDAAIRALR